MYLPNLRSRWNRSNIARTLLWIAAIVLLYAVYVLGIGDNPPGFYVDESALSYNAYLVSTTGAGEFGPKFPLFFQIYTGGFTQWSNPTQIYLLALVFKLFGPGILTARLFSAACVFAASLLMGALALKITGRRSIGVILAAAALLTPWLFEVGRLVLETFFYPMAVVLFLWAVYRARGKDRWTWGVVVTVALTLTLLTYSYTIGRMLGPLLALGLICFAGNRDRFLSIFKTWVVYGLTLVPLAMFFQRNPELATRFQLLSYIKPESTFFEIIVRFASRFMEDLNPVWLITVGDKNQRHHLPDAFGSIYGATLVLAVIGIVVILVRHRRNAWWWFVLYGLAVSVVPAALTIDAHHTLRMVAYPIFLLMLTVPALEWLLEKNAGQIGVHEAESQQPDEEKKSHWDTLFSLPRRRGILGVLLAFTVFEASYFHWKNYQGGGKRGYIFDSAYKPLYDAAVAQPNRPIYLVDAYWGPAYIHSFWYATLEGRGTDEFIHQPYGVRPPAGAIIISTEQNCTGCTTVRRSGDYLLYSTAK